MRFICFLLAALVQVAAAQDPPGTALNPAVPTVTFDSVWESATPQEYVITVKSDGPSTYLSRNVVKPVLPDQKQANENRAVGSNAVGSGEDKRWTEERPAVADEQDPEFHVEFTMSPATAQRIFKDAEQANYFNGSFDFTKHQVANTGRKTLTYADPIRHFQTTFNFSENKALEDLARLFQGISNTIQYGRKLEFKHKYDKLGLEGDLKSMEEAMEYHNLAELQIITPALQSIAEDSSVMNIARARAKRLLGKNK
jgi:hypothetical protein